MVNLLGAPFSCLFCQFGFSHMECFSAKYSPIITECTKEMQVIGKYSVVFALCRGNTEKLKKISTHIGSLLKHSFNKKFFALAYYPCPSPTPNKCDMPSITWTIVPEDEGALSSSTSSSCFQSKYGDPEDGSAFLSPLWHSNQLISKGRWFPTIITASSSSLLDKTQLTRQYNCSP